MVADKAGQFPFTRGIYPNMYQDRLWTMRQYAGFTSAEESNQRYRYLLDQGVSGLSVAFDLPTQIGYDSDHSMAEGEVGKVGVPISSIRDIDRLFKDIPLDQVSTSMTINATAATMLALYIVSAEKNGVAPDKLHGTIQNDILKEYIARGTYIYPPEASMRLVTDVFSFCADHVPKWNTISISGYHIREAGSTAAQELAFTIANGIAYVQAAIDKGLKVDAFGKRLSFFFNAHNDFLTEIAKFRAARSLWAKIMKDRFGATDEKAMLCRFHTQTGGSTLTAQQVDNNVVRTTIQALSAVLGGTQSLHTNAFDEALALPTDNSAKLALRTQQVIAHESGVTNFVDPLGGSEVIEKLTSDLEEEALAIIEKIDNMGGAISAIKAGWVQSEIGKSAYEYQKSVDSKDNKIVGVNSFEEDDESESDLQEINQESVKNQIDGVLKFKEDRDNGSVQSKLTVLQSVANSENNLMPAIIDCIRAECTLGEVADSLRSQFGEF
ncbi:MAG: methylmalonyl-CoA mutase [Candidatus Marinimicrobia bacterium]|nr:methylmalonyl-CoA mutase [Candidatus Neomarinimicrobiota bacterium]MBT3675685.1 methylmalonyl-CoA mutase [Candidatus Neomarinimicrobiota bacterium]MBT3763725.1 methylmalonyl-CoA mutase [Candidatus Neomarinimicrobiota bacterium]MBT4068353.1 methylmalonyl-CoA mutase [Candidatus Neomarinimicrobiota bacterium]MBT4271064.1 methylmalonyl-CoA mutase [Candidatus Neomarinimicrobiota bacterium]